MKFGVEMQKHVNHRVKMIFPLAAHMVELLQHLLVSVKFWLQMSSKDHVLVTSWVWEIIRCEKHEKVPREVLYKVQNCFFPDGPFVGLSTILDTILVIFPYKWTARGKRILNFVQDLSRYHLAFLVPNYLSNSRTDTKLRVHDLYYSSEVKNLPKPVNEVKYPLCVPPEEKSFWHWRSTRFCTSTLNFIKSSFRFTKLLSSEPHLPYFPQTSPRGCNLPDWHILYTCQKSTW